MSTKISGGFNVTQYKVAKDIVNIVNRAGRRVTDFIIQRKTDGEVYRLDVEKLPIISSGQIQNPNYSKSRLSIKLFDIYLVCGGKFYFIDGNIQKQQELIKQFERGIINENEFLKEIPKFDELPMVVSGPKASARASPSASPHVSPSASARASPSASVRAYSPSAKAAARAYDNATPDEDYNEDLGKLDRIVKNAKEKEYKFTDNINDDEKLKDAFRLFLIKKPQRINDELYKHIRNLYRAASIKLHPDKLKDNGEPFKKLNNAYQLITNQYEIDNPVMSNSSNSSLNVVPFRRGGKKTQKRRKAKKNRSYHK